MPLHDADRQEILGVETLIYHLNSTVYNCDL